MTAIFSIPTNYFLRAFRKVSESPGRLVVVLALLFAFTMFFAATPAFSDHAGLALEFDGVDDFVKLLDTSDTLGSSWDSSKTVSVWFNPTAASSPATSPASGALLVGNDRPRTFGISRALYNGLDRIWVWNYDNNGIDIIGVEFTPGEWIQVTLVHDGNTLYAYKNGLLAGSVASGPSYLPSPTADGTLYVGGAARGEASRYFGGQIDEVRLWNVALDQPTIQSWSNQEVTATHPFWLNLAAYHKMSDGAGLVLSDDSAYDNPGALYGGMDDASWVPSLAFTGAAPGPTAFTSGAASVNAMSNED